MVLVKFFDLTIDLWRAITRQTRLGLLWIPIIAVINVAPFAILSFGISQDGNVQKTKVVLANLCVWRTLDFVLRLSRKILIYSRKNKEFFYGVYNSKTRYALNIQALGILDTLSIIILFTSYALLIESNPDTMRMLLGIVLGYFFILPLVVTFNKFLILKLERYPDLRFVIGPALTVCFLSSVGFFYFDLQGIIGFIQIVNPFSFPLIMVGIPAGLYPTKALVISCISYLAVILALNARMKRSI